MIFYFFDPLFKNLQLIGSGEGNMEQYPGELLPFVIYTHRLTHAHL